MTKRENVIKGLECCIVREHPCGDCVYFIVNPNDEDTGWCDRDKILRNAIELLKAQEPKIMTSHDWEANRAEKMPVWIEWSASAKGECADNEKADGWAILNKDGFVDVLCFGGRCWTSQPTDEQRKAVKWDK